MSEDYDHGAIDQALVSAMGAVQSVVMGVGLERYEYKLVPAGQLSAHGADRWRVVPVPSIQEIKQGLAGITPGPPMFLMERQVIVDDTPAGIRPVDWNGHVPDLGAFGGS